MAENVNGNDELGNVPTQPNGNQNQGHRIELDLSPIDEPICEAEEIEPIKAVEVLPSEHSDFTIPDFGVEEPSFDDGFAEEPIYENKDADDAFDIGASPVKPSDDTAPLYDASAYAPKKKRSIGEILKKGNGKVAACVLGVCLIGAISAAAGNAIGNKQAEEAANPAIEIATPDNGRADNANGTGEAESAKDADNDVIDDSVATLPSTEESKDTESSNGETVANNEDKGSSSDAESETAETDKNGTAAEECDHDWKPYKAKKQAIAAKTHTEKTAATYETVTEYHTVCNTCKQKIDGKTKEHASETGHEGYTTNVPIAVTKVKTKASTKTVVDEPAKVKTTWTKEKCKKCKEVRKLDEAKSKTTNKED